MHRINKKTAYNTRKILAKMLPRPLKGSLRSKLGIRYGLPKKVAIIGWLGAFNLGDEMMLDVTLQEMKNRGHEVTLVVHKEDALTRKRYKDKIIVCRPLSKRAIDALARDNDALFVNGGALIDDQNYNHPDSLARDIYRLGHAFISKNKKVIVYGVSTSNSIRNEDFISDFRYLYKHAVHFSVRDRYSQEELQHLFKVSDIKLVDDIEFADSVLTKKFSAPKGRRIIGFIPILLEDTIDAMKDLLERIGDATGDSIRVILFYDENNNDSQCIRKIQRELGDKCSLVNEILSPTNSADLYNALSGVDTVVSMRYHGTLFAGAVGKTVVGVDYDKHAHYPYKNQYLRSEYGIGDSSVQFSEIENLTVEQIRTVIQDAQPTTVDMKNIKQRARLSLNKALDELWS